MVNQQTQQYMYRAIVSTVCLILVLAFLFMFAAALRLGDGEAVKIIDSLQTPILGAFGTLIAFVWGHQATQAAIAKFSSNTSIAASAPNATPATLATATATAGDSAVAGDASASAAAPGVAGVGV